MVYGRDHTQAAIETPAQKFHENFNQGQLIRPWLIF